MPRSRSIGILAGTIGAATIAIALTGCVPNKAAADAEAISVTLNDEKCTVSTATAPSGAVTFQVTNTGSDVNEFEVLAEDKLRIAGEKENVGPGTTVNYVVQLAEGDYFTACKKGMVGSPTSYAKFTVTKGEKANVSASDSKQVSQAVTNYISYVKDQSGQLLTATQAFAKAYEAGDDATAKAQYPAARAFYERIEPTAEQFGDIDPAIDLREADLEAGQSWTGWHRIEKDLWAPAGFTPSDAAGRKVLGDQLVADTQKLYDLVYAKNFSLTIDQISNGAIGLMEEVSRSKITGEEETFSHTDLWDFQANVEGAQVAYGIVRDIAEGKGSTGKQVVAKLDTEFAAITKLLGQYKSGDGFVSYTDLSTSQVKELSDEVNALSEPLSQLTSIIVK
ncbi:MULTISPECIES: iron uptake system protein EfeO [unclassified Leifsonia]|uniref:iron uptake system protein EfeO n=1 Tax=unclassified Leifsonia TaxID=2663824 RepID=UPI000A194C40|nr:MULTISPECIES: iron uptake system protein EfeO [unclassified Leifsonia]QIZ99197.1 peptidase M75 family protein [Leifsonia sp. PS1209]